jgi:hypothetical protein
MKRFMKYLLTGSGLIGCMGWGFFAHQKINRLAVFILPPGMIGFYKANLQYVSEAAVNPDRRRYASKDEAPRHFIDLDRYGSTDILPRQWAKAAQEFCEDSLKAHGILPWHIQRVYAELRNAFAVRDPEKILRLSADLGHYIADAHVPLHTSSNYDGQKSGQNGIHAFWESRLPELYFTEYDFFVGSASYLPSVSDAAWESVRRSHAAVDSVLFFEQQLYKAEGEGKFNFESRGRRTVKVVSPAYAHHYHRLLSGMVERLFRASVKMTGDVWYSAWVDAGQPDLAPLIRYTPSEEELQMRRDELFRWKQQARDTLDRDHRND